MVWCVWCGVYVVPTITRPVNFLYTKVWLALWARVHEPWPLLCLTRCSHHEVVALVIHQLYVLISVSVCLFFVVSVRTGVWMCMYSRLYVYKNTRLYVFTCLSVSAVPCNTVLVCAARSRCDDLFLMDRGM